MQLNLNNQIGFGLFEGQFHSPVSGVYHLLNKYSPRLGELFITRYTVIMNNIYSGYLDSLDAMNFFWLREIAGLPIGNIPAITNYLHNSNLDTGVYLDSFERYVLPLVINYLDWWSFR